MANESTIAAAVAELVHVPDTDERLVRSVRAAAGYVCLVENVTDVNGDALAGAAAIAGLPDDELVEAGLVKFARALYVDAAASHGQQLAVGDGVVDTLFTPEDVYKRHRHYFAGVASSWGVA